MDLDFYSSLSKAHPLVSGGSVSFLLLQSGEFRIGKLLKAIAINGHRGEGDRTKQRFIAISNE
ncbi:MAG: hypothetical protein HC838_16960 [Spirulinaceae cyanobacterium RM2_2_10]|nr:hypothetical protein [Spirulinaceae cyanobacterium SM2_1_0]NJO21383.1 hypothetical protein [Spirulinaceae cyanobacterium RM2_2_10]